jgi:hypothetical protein
MKYRKKPVVIDAEQYNGQHIEGLEYKIEHPEEQHRADVSPYIQTLEGRMHVTHGDWIITGVKGEKYPCKPDIFEATYEPV